MAIDIRADQHARSESGIIRTSPQKNLPKSEVKPVESSYKSFTMNRYKWAHDSINTADSERKNVQKIILEEFQPNFIYDIGKVIDSSKALGLLIDAAVGFGGAGLAAALQVAKVNMYNNLATQYSVGAGAALDVPITFIEKYFEGSILNSFEMPFINDRYLHADTTNNWSTAGSERYLGSKINSVLKEHMNMDFPTTPTWTLGDYKGDTLEYNFYLINDTESDLINNYTFLNALISGAYWIQMDLLQKSPNVYRVTVPGRFIWIYAAMGVDVKMQGKLRRVYNIPLPSAGGLLSDGDTLFPDAYYVTITLRNLAPENFNTYLNYPDKGSKRNINVTDKKVKSRVGVGDIVDAATNGTPALKNTFEVLKQTYKDGKQAIGGTLAERGKDAWNIVTPK